MRSISLAIGGTAEGRAQDGSAISHYISNAFSFRTDGKRKYEGKKKFRTETEISMNRRELQQPTHLIEEMKSLWASPCAAGARLHPFKCNVC